MITLNDTYCLAYRSGVQILMNNHDYKKKSNIIVINCDITKKDIFIFMKSCF